jgi:hypothetical protein
MGLLNFGLKSARSLLGLFFLATACAAPAIAERFEDTSTVREVDSHTYLVGFDYEEVLLIMSTYDELSAIIGTGGNKSYSLVPVGSKMTASASIERTGNGLCTSYFVGLQTDYGVFEFGIIKDKIDASQATIFFVANSEGGCPPIQSDGAREYSLRSLLVKRDGYRNNLIFQLSNDSITFEEGVVE